ncbi:MAG TPA: sulfotransferase domain-containing protein [Terriglobia bacterium]
MSVLRRLRRKASRSRLRAPLVWYRHRGLTPRDVFVASYPRSGSTWLRFLLLELLTRDSAGFDRVNQMIPDVGRHGGCPALLPGRRRLIKTHETYRSTYGTAIYIVRDLRDVVLSEFDYENARQRLSEDFDTFLMLSLKANVNGYGSWQEHVVSWVDSPLESTGRLLVIKFEELRARTEDTLAEVAYFLGVTADRGAIQEAIANNSVQRMREKEDQVPEIDGYSTGNGNSSRFIGKGSVGGWRARLSEGQLQLVERCAGLGLARMGYPLETALVPTGNLSRL